MDNSLYVTVLADIFDESILPQLDNISLSNFANSCKSCHVVVQRYISRFTEVQFMCEELLFHDNFTKKGVQELYFSVHGKVRHGKYRHKNDLRGPNFSMIFNYFRGELQGKFQSYGVIHNIPLLFQGCYHGGILHGPLFVKYHSGKIREIWNFNMNIPQGFGKNYQTFAIKGADAQISSKFNIGKKISYYKNGCLRGFAFFSPSGLLHGIAEKLYKSGKIKVKKNFSAGKLHGEYEKKNRNGDRIIYTKFYAGEIETIKYEKPYLFHGSY
jgi:hypothetical protein